MAFSNFSILSIPFIGPCPIFKDPWFQLLDLFLARHLLCGSLLWGLRGNIRVCIEQMEEYFKHPTLVIRLHNHDNHHTLLQACLREMGAVTFVLHFSLQFCDDRNNVDS